MNPALTFVTGALIGCAVTLLVVLVGVQGGDTRITNAAACAQTNQAATIWTYEVCLKQNVPGWPARPPLR